LHSGKAFVYLQLTLAPSSWVSSRAPSRSGRSVRISHAARIASHRGSPAEWTWSVSNHQL